MPVLDTMNYTQRVRFGRSLYCSRIILPRTVATRLFLTRIACGGVK